MTSFRIAVVVLNIFVTALATGIAREKITTWDTGTLLAEERKQNYLGTAENSTTFGSHSHSATTAMYDDYVEYTIDSPQLVYLARETLRRSRSKPALLTINAPVKFHVDGASLRILDDAGKEHETTIVKRVSKLEVASRSATIADAPVLPARPLTNEDVLNLKKAGIGDDLIVLKIKNSRGAYRVEAGDLIALHQAGLPDAVIAAMMQAMAH